MFRFLCVCQYYMHASIGECAYKCDHPSEDSRAGYMQGLCIHVVSAYMWVDRVLLCACVYTCVGICVYVGGSYLCVCLCTHVGACMQSRVRICLERLSATLTSNGVAYPVWCSCPVLGCQVAPPSSQGLTRNQRASKVSLAPPNPTAPLKPRDIQFNGSWFGILDLGMFRCASVVP